jgi:hypothetical protein
MARNGKIARLPHAVREELNRRLRDGERGGRLIEWLNSLPEVQAVLAAQFKGEPIHEDNLSRHRHGAYQDWLDEQVALADVRLASRDAGKSGGAAPGAMSDRFATWLAGRVAVAAIRLERNKKGPDAEWKLLREFCHDLMVLRRGDQEARRLELEEERLKLARGRGVGKSALSDEECERRIMEILGLSDDRKPSAAEKKTETADVEARREDGK